MIVIFIIILFLFLIYLVYKKIEKFEDVQINNDFYIPNDVAINQLSERKINASNICIFERSEGKITDIECINADELISTLSLPKERMKMVCVDNNCLDAEDLKLLNGEKNFKITSESEHESYTGKCLGDNKRVKLRRCGHNIPDSDHDKIYSLSPVSCSDGNSLNFKLIMGANSDKNLSRDELTGIPTMPTVRRIQFVEGHRL